MIWTRKRQSGSWQAGLRSALANPMQRQEKEVKHAEGTGCTKKGRNEALYEYLEVRQPAEVDVVGAC